ncbi:MAG: glycosyltransferase family 39 protein [Frankiaceae bacterium]
MGRPAAAAGGRWRLGLAVLAGVAFALRLAVLTRAGGVATAIEYDDGVHYGVSALLLHGVLPYRDQVFLQPPGIAVLLLPCAAVGRLVGDAAGLASARIATCAVGAVTAWLLGRLVAREVGPGAGLAAAAVYATAAGSLLAESTVLLEPFLNLFTVLALSQLASGRRDGRRGRLLLAGALIGVAGTVKLWAVAPLAASLMGLLLVRRYRDAGRFAAAAAATAALLAGPFLLLAPVAALRDIVATQATRPSAGTAGLGSRLRDMSGVAPLGTVAAVTVLGTVIGLGILAVRRCWLARLAGAQLCLSVGLFTVGRPYFSHYADFLVPPAAILVGVGITQAARRTTPWVGAAAVLAAVAVGGGEIAAVWSSVSRAAVSTTRLRAALPARGCVLADQPVLAVYAGALARTGCPAWLDPRGTGLTELGGRSAAGFYPDGFRALPGWQQRWLRWAGEADAAVLTGEPCGHSEWRPAVCGYLTQHFHLVAVVGRATPNQLPVQVWLRTSTRRPARQVRGRPS